MALNIPNTDLPGNSFLKGVQGGSSMFSRLMQPILEREKQKQLEQHFQEQLKLNKAASGRAAQSASDAHKLALMKMDPNYKFQQVQNMLNNLQSLGGKQNNPNVTNAQPGSPSQNLMQMITGNQGQEFQQGQGMLMPEQQENPQLNQNQVGESPDENNQLPGGLDLDQIKRALVYQSLGLKQPANGVYKEPPDIKRQNDLKSKMEEAKYKHELKVEEEKTKKELENQETRHKVIEEARSDLPHLEETLRSLQIMQKIAKDPANKDLFGHWLEGHDVAARRTKNPNAGTWQVYGLDPIVAAEMKMSARGNQLALKSALGNKANFGESQNVAEAKIEGSIDKIKRQIEQMKHVANEGQDDFGKMTDEQLRAIVGGS